MRFRWLRRHRAVLLIGVMAMVMAACSGESSTTTAVPQEPTVTFDGANCVYAGPASFDLNTLAGFTGINEADDIFVFALYHLEDPSLTLEDVIALDSGLQPDSMPDGIRLRSASSRIDPGAEGSVSLPFTASGDYLIGCFIAAFEESDQRVVIAAVVLSVP